MSWVTIIWAMTAAACLTLAGVDALVWWRRRAVRAHLLFAVAAMATAGLAWCEFWMMQAKTPGEFGLALKWLHVPSWVLVLALVGFVREYLKAGRPWLGWAVCGLQTVSLILNFLLTPSLSYHHIAALQRVRLFGESVAVAEGVASPWMLVGQLSLALLVVFVADATVIVWRRGDRRRALMIGGSILLFALAGTGQAVLFLRGIILAPLALSLFFLGCIAAMSYELSDDVLRAARLSGELRESEFRLRNLADTAPVMIWMSGPDKRYTYFNQCWLDFTGRSPEEQAGDGWMASVHPEDVGSRVTGYYQAFDARQPFTAEYRLRRYDGQYRWLLVQAVPRLTSQGAFLGYIGFCMDITERKAAETETQRQQAEMAQMARVSTMGQLASALAHELNQPLGAILRNAEAGELILKEKQPDYEEVRAILEDIRRDDQRAGAVIDRMRAMLKRRELDFEPLSLKQLFDQVTALTRAEMLTRRVTVQVNLANDLPPVRGDRVHLQQVLLNLLVNGADAMNGAPVERRQLKVRARRTDNGMVEVAVRDSGHGIPEEKLGQLFEPFVTTKSHGLGMGLAISRTIVKSHGGRIWAENNAEGGATLRFTLKTVEGNQ